MTAPGATGRLSGFGLKLVGGIGSCAGAFLLVSAFLWLVPGDPIDLILGEQAAAMDRAAMRHALGLDLPWYGQLWSFCRDFATGQLRSSVPPAHELVWPQIARALPHTATLTAAALGLALLIAIPAGAMAAATRGRTTSTATTGLASLLSALPRFWLGPMLLIVFAVRLSLFPSSGADGLQSLVLPAVTLALPMCGLLMRLTQSSVADALDTDYARTARAKGLREVAVVFRHALPNALAPIIAVVGVELGALLGGAVVTEKVFGWPGMGMLLVTAIERRDYNSVRAVVLVATFIAVLANALADAGAALVDPRARDR